MQAGSGPPSTTTLLSTINALWEKACRLSHPYLSHPPEQQMNESRVAVEERRRHLSEAISCLMRGLELVLPAEWEIKFRLFLAEILLTFTDNTETALEQLRKCLFLIKTKSINSRHVKYLLAALAYQYLLPANKRDRKIATLMAECRKEAISNEDFCWWIKFDLMALNAGNSLFILESSELLEQKLSEGGNSSNVELFECHVFVFTILSRLDPQVNKTRLTPLIEGMINGEIPFTPSSTNVYASITCLRLWLEEGVMERAKSIALKLGPHIKELASGILPGGMFVTPNLLRITWTRLMAIISLRLGESPTSVIQELIPDIFDSLKSPLLKTENCFKKEENNTPYALLHDRLYNLLKDSKNDALRVLSDVDSMGLLESPNLESFRLLIIAIAQSHANMPVHQIKASLLSSLKLLNTTTQNVQMKAIVLILVGELYLSTDFEMAIKMNSAALTFAKQAQWDLIAFYAARGLKIAHEKKGMRKESIEYEKLAQQLLLKSTDLLPTPSSHSINITNNI